MRFGSFVLAAVSVLAQDPAFEKPSPVPAHKKKQARAQAVEPRQFSTPLPPPLPIAPAAGSEAGTALFYYAGKRKPSSDAPPVDSREFTAEHPYYPLGSLVRVINTQNDKETKVRITGRILPSSRAVISVDDRAARALDFYRLGVGQVRVELIGEKP